MNMTRDDERQWETSRVGTKKYQELEKIAREKGFGTLLPDSDLQSVAEAVHLAIKLLEDGQRESRDIHDEDESTGFFYWKGRSQAVVDELKPAMMILAPYMPSVISGSNSGEPALREDEDAPSVEDERGFLDGTDEQSYAERHS